MLFNLLFFTGIIIIVVLVSKRNFKERMDDLKKNLSSFNEDIRKFFHSMPLDAQEKFMKTGDERLIESLKSILEDRFIYGRNVWAVQQQIAQMQELFVKLKKINGKV